MNATVTALTPERRVRRAGDAKRLTALRAALRPDFLAEAGWNPAAEVLAPPRTHKQLGLRKCVVLDCEAGVRSHRSQGLCQSCVPRFTASGLALEEFVSLPSGKSRKGERWCRVTRCERISVLRSRLCPAHDQQRRKKHPDLSAEQFAALPDLVPFASFGPCRVRSCDRGALYQGMRICPPHNASARPSTGSARTCNNCSPTANVCRPRPTLRTGPAPSSAPATRRSASCAP